MKYLIDSSAWIEYLNGSKTGEKVSKVLRGNNEIFILPLNIAEVISKVRRISGNIDVAYESMVSNALVLEANPKTAKEAGLLHAQLRKKSSSISIADTLMVASARAISANVLTTDKHFKDFKEAILLGSYDKK